MTESSKKRKKHNHSNSNQTIANHNKIDANWQKFLASGLLMDNKTEKPAEEPNKQHFTGTFRRARKKKSKEQKASSTVQNGLKTLNLDTIPGQNKSSTPTIVANGDTKPLSPEKQSKKPNHVDSSNKNKLKPNHVDSSNKNKLTKFIAMDCEMVGIGYNGDDHMLARVSLVNKFGDCIYDKFVKPREEVVDYRTSVSGVRREDLINAEEFSKVQKDVAEILRGRILVGHSLKHDLSVLFLSHPKRNIRDTARYKPFRQITKGSTPSLKRLAKEVLGIEIQSAEHSSVEDATAAMQLYCTVAKKWENVMSEKRGYNRKILDEA